MSCLCGYRDHAAVSSRCAGGSARVATLVGSRLRSRNSLCSTIRTIGPFSLGGRIKERADAARNRAAILSAAGQLFDDATDPASVSMDAIAQAAGVGKGTLFRRFGDRSTLLLAVYDQRLDDLRIAVGTRSEPIDPAERIAGVLEAIVVFKLRNRRLVHAVEDARNGSTSLYVTAQYTEILDLIADSLTHMEWPRDVVWTAHALLALTRIDLIDHWATKENMSATRIVSEVRSFTDRLLRR
ncbi:TetR/AcrR family transcriptional regulator [Mycolicibacterium murale]|uniref:TetR/AcrR family transcriptional regulator n=1 Tax=Mycolicibacterium murale TaxID=182220 RepID=UPI001FE965E1